MRYMVYVRIMRLERIGYLGEGRVYPGEAESLSKKAGHRTSPFYFILLFRAQGLGNATIAVKNKPMDSGRGAIEWRELNLSFFGVTGGFFIR